MLGVAQEIQKFDITLEFVAHISHSWNENAQRVLSVLYEREFENEISCSRLGFNYSFSISDEHFHSGTAGHDLRSGLNDREVYYFLALPPVFFVCSIDDWR